MILVNKTDNNSFEYDFDEEQTVDAYLKQHWIVYLVLFSLFVGSLQ